MKYKLAALDMDGTLLKYDKSLHPDTAADLKDAVDHGIEIAYCTGRAVPEVTMYREKLPFIRYGICMSGAVIYDIPERKCLYRKSIGRQYVRLIAAAGERNDGMLQFLSDTVSLARADQIARMADYRAGDLQELFRLTAVPVDDMMAEAEKYTDFPKVNVFFPAAECRTKMLEEIRNLPVSWDYLGSTAIEIKPEGISKAGGLRMLADRLGIDMTETIAIGDGYNDQGMIETAGLGVAMGNAQPQVKEACDMITMDNEHNGVGYALRRAIHETTF